MRRLTAGNKEADGHRLPLSAQMATEFEADERPHAVPEDGKGTIQLRSQYGRQRLDQRRQLPVGRLKNTRLSAWQLNAVKLDAFRQAGRPF